MSEENAQGRWPSDEEIVEIVRKEGSIAGAARSIGGSQSGLKDHINRRGIKAQVDAAREQSLRQTIATDDDEYVPVDNPLRILTDQQKAEIKALRRENTDYSKQLATQEDFFQRIVEATRVPTTVPEIKVADQPDHLPERSVICPIYDQQYGQFVRASDTPANVGGFNAEIFDQRLARYVEGVTGSIRDYAQSHRIDELIIPLGGDHVEGDEIFAGQSWQLEVDPPRQVWDLSTKMAYALEKIVRFAKEELGVPKIAIYGVTGNHGKVGGKKAGARPSTYNWDWLFLMLLRDRLRDLPIDQFEIEPGGSLLFGCADHVFLAIHGDEIRGWGGLPFYGLTRYDGRAMRLHRVLYDYLLMGHHHQPATIPNGSGEHIVSGDWVGANNLSRFITAASRPQQRVLYVARKWGIVEDSRIYFTTSEDAHEQPTIHGV